MTDQRTTKIETDPKTGETVTYHRWTEKDRSGSVVMDEWREVSRRARVARPETLAEDRVQDFKNLAIGADFDYNWSDAFGVNSTEGARKAKDFFSALHGLSPDERKYILAECGVRVDG